MKALGALLSGLVGLVAVGAIIAAFIFGASWLSVRVYPLLVPASYWALLACVFVLLPGALFRPTRGFAGLGFLIASFVFGAVLWTWSFIVTMVLWGVFGVIIGLLLAGVGIVPVALLAILFHGEWHRLEDLLLLIALTLGARFLAFWIISKAGEPTPDS